MLSLLRVHSAPAFYRRSSAFIGGQIILVALEGVRCFKKTILAADERR